MDKKTIQQLYLTRFGQEPDIIARAPGRINLIGEHTDYNAGYVLPGAIDKAIWFAAGKRTDAAFHFFAADLDQSFRAESGATQFQQEKTWTNYLLGVISEARKDGIHPGGINLVFGSDIPLGAGLSSSAALESGVLFLLNELYQLGLSRMDIVKLAQRGENEFVGMKCGIMDMFASVMGRENHVVRLDCRNLQYEYFPFDAPDVSLVLCDSGVKHALVDSEYNTRRAECEEGVRILQSVDASLKSLRDVSPEFLSRHAAMLPPVILQRCIYVVEEIRRVTLACEALLHHDMTTLGQLMFETHSGLQRDYQVSCPEIDFLVEEARKNPSVLGARMMGGGFGGCTINLVKKEAVPGFVAQMQEAYQQNYQRKLKTYPVQLTNGTEVLNG
ncbi:MAG TPA: galactokinase [Saprospiraceae bacterium]|nr:galactokinase [Saprospiraceae bacterium]